MDLWFLMDFEKGLWVKQHTIQVDLSVQGDKFLGSPLLVLDDGRIVTYVGTMGLLRIYNPRTSTYTYVAEMGPCDGFGLYTGNLLSLANGAS
uniref:F-box associated domain-containing protein n=1 Tax=Arundo donax TaxID=35708 RepID=A0A0A8ZBY0_ARUDO